MAGDAGLLAKAGEKAAGILPSLASIGFGIADRIKGKKEYKKAQSFFEKNKYEIPESAKAALGNAERAASGLRMPGEDILRSRFGEATSGAIGASKQVASSGSDVLSILGDVYGQQQEQEQNVMLAGANRYDRNQAALRGELGRMAGFEQEKWQYNSLMPYQQMLDRAGTFSSRGTAGISAGLTGLGMTAANNQRVQGAENRWLNDYNTMMGEQPQSQPQTRITTDDKPYS